MDTPETNQFGEQLKWFRKRANFTQEALAHEIGQQTRGNIQAWEVGQLPRERDIVTKLAHALRLSENETDRFLLAARYPQEYNTQGVITYDTKKEEQTIQYALRNAIQRYATSDLHPELSRPILEKKSFLNLPPVWTELLQLTRFERTPDVKLIGEHWKRAISNPPTQYDFTAEAQRLLDYFQSELRSTETFRPAFDSKSLGVIADQTADASNSLKRIDAQLTDLTDLLTARYNKLVSSFGEAPEILHEQIYDSTRLIQEKTHDFVGRKFVFDAITHFVDTHKRGYYFIQGDPGIGKSSLVAQIVKTNGYVHHFNNLNQHNNTANIFLSNICAQLIVAYQLNYASLPLKATQNAKFLSKLLEEIRGKRDPQEKVIIVIDALDEVDMSGHPSGANALYLPDTLPECIYMIVTTRKKSIDLRINCEFDLFKIEHDSVENIADIRKYIERVVSRPGIQTYITAQGINNKLFIDYLTKKSEYNFMYLCYVLPQIEYGYYKDLNLKDLPGGLQNYYEDHWRRMRAKDEEVWFKYKLPIIMALTEAKEPISIDLIADFSRIQERARVREVLHEWAQFLHEKKVPCKGILQKRYSVYHTSFQDFIAKKEQEGEEGVSRAEADAKIIETMLSGLELFDDI